MAKLAIGLGRNTLLGNVRTLRINCRAGMYIPWMSWRTIQGRSAKEAIAKCRYFVNPRHTCVTIDNREIPPGINPDTLRHVISSFSDCSSVTYHRRLPYASLVQIHDFQDPKLSVRFLPSAGARRHSHLDEHHDLRPSGAKPVNVYWDESGSCWRYKEVGTKVERASPGRQRTLFREREKDGRFDLLRFGQRQERCVCRGSECPPSLVPELIAVNTS
jgi:hypothetical protein